MSTAIDLVHRFRPALSAFGLIVRSSEAQADSAAIRVESGTGAPTHTSVQNTLYVREDASDSGTWLYRNTTGAAVWEAAIDIEATELLAQDNAWTGTNDFSKTVTAADQLINADLSFNHATATGIGLDVTAAQITTVRTSGTLTGVKSSVTSLSGDTAGVDYYAYEAAVTVGAAGADHFAFKVGGGFDETIDASACATTEAGWLLAANLANAWHLKTAALTYVVLRSTTATPGIDETFALSGTGDAHNIAATMSHATQVAEGLDVSIAQITNARTSGTVSAIRASVTSLTGSTAGVDHYAYEAAVTAGEAAADHFVMKIGAGFDNTFDASACATTEAGWLVAANVADAWHLKSSALTYAVLRTTTATPGIDETFTLTATGDAHNIQAIVNSATGVVQGLDVGITTATTNHTSGSISAIRAEVTSLVGDTGGTFACLEMVSTDGGGTTPTHAGLHTVSPLDALLIVGASGQGSVVVGAMTAKNPETDTEAGYFSIRVGATRYEVPMYAVA